MRDRSSPCQPSSHLERKVRKEERRRRLTRLKRLRFQQSELPSSEEQKEYQPTYVLVYSLENVSTFLFWTGPTRYAKITTFMYYVSIVLFKIIATNSLGPWSDHQSLNYTSTKANYSYHVLFSHTASILCTCVRRSLLSPLLVHPIPSVSQRDKLDTPAYNTMTTTADTCSYTHLQHGTSCTTKYDKHVRVKAITPTTWD